MQLAIDTATDTASLALLQDAEVLAELTWRCGQNHTTQLLPHLLHLLNQTKLSLSLLTCVIVSKGPGSFNGLRVGMSTAKGLAFSLDIPIVGISTLEAEAYQYAESGLPVCPVFNAGHGEIATAVYQNKGHCWRQLVAEQIATVDDLCSQVTSKTIFCGEFVSTLAAQLRKQLRQKAIILSPTTGLRRASFLAELGLKRIERGDYDDPVTLQPQYLRAPAITKSKKREMAGN